MVAALTACHRDPRQSLEKVVEATPAGGGCASVRERCLPALDFTDLYGVPHSLRAANGKVTVVNFWATWCAPCLTEIPELSEVQDRLRERGVELFGVLSGDDTPVAQLTGFVGDLGMSYPSVVGTESILAAFDDPHELPTTFVFDRSGSLRLVHPGTISGAELEEAVRPLAEAP